MDIYNDENIAKQLNELTIFSLRELARQTGVTSPTSKNKETLIEEIVAIRQGKQQPVFSKNKGRPPKSYKHNWADMFKNETPTHSNSFFVLKQNVGEFSYEDDEIITKIGFVEILKNNTSFLWVNENNTYIKYFIPANLIENHKIKFGDKISADVSTYPQMIVKDIYTINGNAVNSICDRPTIFEEIAHTPTNNQIKLAKHNINYGENVFIYGENNSENTQNIIDLLNNSSADNKLYINVSITDKNKHLLNNLKDSENFTVSLMENLETSKKVISLAIEYAKRLFEENKNVIIAIDDLLSLTSIDDFNLTLTKTMLSLSKYNGGSITIYAVNTKQASLNIFEKLVDKRIILN